MNMSEFENFYVPAWLADGLTRHLKLRRRVEQVKRLADAPWKNRVILPIVATAGAAAAALISAPATAETRGSWAEYFTPQEVASLDPDLVPGTPADFWAKQIAKVRKLKREARQDVVDPPSIF